MGFVSTHRDTTGRALGFKAEQTRQTLLDNLAEYLETAEWREASVLEVCRRSERSAATFWTYWNGFEEAVQEVIQNKEAALKRRRLPDRWRLIKALMVNEGSWRE